MLSVAKWHKYSRKQSNETVKERTTGLASDNKPLVHGTHPNKIRHDVIKARDFLPGCFIVIIIVVIITSTDTALTHGAVG